jgi:transposase
MDSQDLLPCGDMFLAELRKKHQEAGSAERRGADLDTWLTQAERSGLPKFKKMAKGIRLDYAAVKAAFASDWSNAKARSTGQLADRFKNGLCSGGPTST